MHIQPTLVGLVRVSIWHFRRAYFFGHPEMLARCGSEAHSGARLCGQNPLAAKLDPILKQIFGWEMFIKNAGLNRKIMEHHSNQVDQVKNF